uniref:Secreted protein n=1 Tax=Anopheles atroparvus TaxID=41427 RepID=A0AAG5DJJ8_ANOAO
MYFKNPLCQVLCLVITVILYRGATAECDSNSMEALISYKLEKLEQCMIEKVKQERTDASEFHHDSFSNETSVRNIMERIGQKSCESLQRILNRTAPT